MEGSEAMRETNIEDVQKDTIRVLRMAIKMGPPDVRDDFIELLVEMIHEEIGDDRMLAIMGLRFE